MRIKMTDMTDIIEHKRKNDAKHNALARRER